MSNNQLTRRPGSLPVVIGAWAAVVILIGLLTNLLVAVIVAFVFWAVAGRVMYGRWFAGLHALRQFRR